MKEKEDETMASDWNQYLNLNVRSITYFNTGFGTCKSPYLALYRAKCKDEASASRFSGSDISNTRNEAQKYRRLRCRKVPTFVPKSIRQDPI
jgi:hypothetical protein